MTTRKHYEEVEGLAEKEQEDYVLASSVEGVGTIILNKGEIVKHYWENKNNFVEYSRMFIDDEEIDEMVNFDFSFVEVKFLYSYENYVRFLEERGVFVE
ncbi:gp167 [Bacillus phage W.Ph.]|uniref:Gp167 n=1 Tax=Bacillus phage W.Ph. TaxID=764595 RepID=G9B1R8_9CAUD|nr:gp167 [Bacillus phage W.Ph.]ADH03313.1 gp167 [Bacillus phage W.Ph.]